MAEIALEAGSPWIGKIGSFQIPFIKDNFTRIMGLLAVLVASKWAVVL